VRELRDVGDSLSELSVVVVVSPGTPISVVDRSTLVGNVEDSYDGVTMNGSVVRNVCWVVGTLDVMTVGVVGVLH
jgi:hypothetical protein